MTLDRVVVTGGAGFIGSNLAEELAGMCEVTLIDNLSTGQIGNIGNLVKYYNVDFIEGSINDLDLLRRAFDGAYCIFHQAAIPSVQRSLEDPLSTNEVNVTGTLKVLVAARDCGVNKVVYASSSSVYGDSLELPKREDMLPNPKSPYAISKLAGEYYCRVFSEIYGIKTISLRYFNVYGPKQDPDSDYAAVIPKFITKILNNEPPLIFGDGEQTRDFTFVKDVVRANILAMNADLEGVFNIASGERISINELAKKIMEITGVHIQTVHSNPRSGDVRDSLAEVSAARDKLAYVPEFNLEKGLNETVKWFMERLLK